jgi:hypothetical protein|tara:strand:+ start:196 stop:654 length:459 start_codon:yes stop_codon:yes gene_type:complete
MAKMSSRGKLPMAEFAALRPQWSGERRECSAQCEFEQLVLLQMRRMSAMRAATATFEHHVQGLLGCKGARKKSELRQKRLTRADELRQEGRKENQHLGIGYRNTQTLDKHPSTLRQSERGSFRRSDNRGRCEPRLPCKPEQISRAKPFYQRE